MRRFLSSNIIAAVFHANRISANFCANRVMHGHNLSLTALEVDHFTQNTHDIMKKNVQSVPLHEQTCKSFEDLTEAVHNNDYIYSSDIENVLKKYSYTEISQTNAQLLLRCGSSMFRETPAFRAEMCKKIWKILTYSHVPAVNSYNTYISTCTQNKNALDCGRFISEMKCKPDIDTLKLLLENACEHGDVIQSKSILESIKNKGMHVDESVFNSLLLGYVICGGSSMGKSVLGTMHTANIQKSSATRLAILRGLAIRGDKDDFFCALSQSAQFPEDQLLQLITSLGHHGRYLWLPQMMKILGNVTFSKKCSEKLTNLCIEMVYVGQPEAAFIFYQTFIPHAGEENYAFSLMLDMLKCNVPAEALLAVAKSLRDSGKNILALENITRVALKNNNLDVAWPLLQSLCPLRPHYFWPILLQVAKEKGEPGILDALRKMIKLGVQPDFETLEFYCFRLCNLTDVRALLKRFQELGFTVKQLFSPLLSELLKSNRVPEAYALCESFNVELVSDKLLRPAFFAWKNGGSLETVIVILSRICESDSSNEDRVGHFLQLACKKSSTKEEYRKVVTLMKAIEKRHLRISPASADILTQILEKRCSGKSLISELQSVLEKLLDISKDTNTSLITHPRNMNAGELECHLEELRSKNMDTRGLMRRLIQDHCRLGNIERVRQLRKEFVDAGYRETAGMKSSMFYVYVQNGHLSLAANIYEEIKVNHPNFTVDSYKIVDFAALLVNKSQFESAVNLLFTANSDGNVRGGQAIERNCWRLLSAATSEEQVRQLFDVLLKCGYCSPSNVILGPLVRVHLSKGKLEEAVTVFAECAEKYVCTPLQLELLCAVVSSRQEDLLHRVLCITESVHGKDSSLVTFISALAQTGREKSLRKVLIDCERIPHKLLEARCERWVAERQVTALTTLAKAVHGFPVTSINSSMVYLYIIRVYSEQNDCESALSFWQKLDEMEEVVPRSVTKELTRLLRRCSYSIPEKISVLS